MKMKPFGGEIFAGYLPGTQEHTYPARRISESKAISLGVKSQSKNGKKCPLA